MASVIHAPQDGATLSLLPASQRAFLTDQARMIPHRADPAVNAEDGTIPPSLLFVWSNGPERAVLQLAQASDFSIIEQQIPALVRDEHRLATVSSLLPGHRYFWRIADDHGAPLTEPRSFAVANELPRWILLPKVTNVRDCGGWSADGGHRVRFGKLFRGAQFERWTFAEHGSPLTSDGEWTLLSILKVRTELDLRGGGAQVFCHPDLNYVNISLSAYCWGGDGIFTDEQMEHYGKVFALLADSNAYPVYFHCQGGGDRTGTLAFMIGAALGVSEQELLTDYELSTLSLSGERTRFSEVWRTFRERLSTCYPATTLQGQVIAYLHACGVTEEMLANLRANLLE